MRWLTVPVITLALLAQGLPAFAQAAAAKDARIDNENTRHASVLIEMSYRRVDAKREYKIDVAYCAGDEKCLYAQKINYYRTIEQVDLETHEENLQHAQILRTIELAYPEPLPTARR